MLFSLLATDAWPAERQTLYDHVPAAAKRLAPVGRLDSAKRLKLAIGLPLRDQQGLTRFLQELAVPASANYRKYLTPAQFTERFGPTQTDYEAVVRYAKTHGLTVTARHPNRVVLDVESTASGIENAFRVKLRTYRHPKEAREFYAPDREPALDLPVPISHISGLDNYSLPHPNLKLKPAGLAAKAAPNSGSAPGGSYGGGDFRAAYVPGTALTGVGQSVGLLQFDGYYASDISAYRTLFSLPNIPLVNVAVDGGVTTPGTGNSEVCLDIEMVMSMAPGVSTIYVYEAPNPSPWVDLLSKMANDNLAKQLSCSWGGGGPDATAETIFQQMAAQGQTFFNATGDSDAFTGSISFPSDSPNVVEVGATTLSTTGAGGSYVSETVWNWGGSTGSSGGSSTYYTIPTWQQVVSMATNQGSTTMRNVPDVALTGDAVYVLYNNGGSGSFGGTSCAAPLWAGFTALMNQQTAAYGRAAVGFINPAIYAIGKDLVYTSDFHDTTAGNNFSTSSPSKFSAVTGYDLCTGWGTPTGTALINAVAGAPDYLLVSPSSFASSGAPGGPFTPSSNTYTLSNSGSTSLAWKVVATQTWLTLSGTGGTLAAGGSTTLIASLNANANGLVTGTYSDTITFTDTTTGIAQPTPVSLRVAVPAPIMSVTPATAYVSAGSVGGPFTPSSGTYTVTNTGNAAMNWAVSNTTGWITLSATGGALASGGTATLTATINTTANSLASGTYSGVILFTNMTNGIGNSTRTATLGIAPAPALFFNLNTDPGWTRQGQWAFGKPLGSGGASYGHPDPTAGASGTNVFGVNLSGDYSITVGGPYYLTAGPFDFTNYTGVKLQFQRWLNSDYRPFVAATIDVSNNGSTWTAVFSNSTSTVSDAAWTQVQYDLSSVANSHSGVYVRWGYQILSGGAWPYSGWNIDDIAFLGTATAPVLGIAVPATLLKGLQTSGTVVISSTTLTATVVSLTSSLPAHLTVPGTVTIAAGSVSAPFTIAAPDDSLMDGTQFVTVTGSVSGMGAVSGTIGVLDHNVHHFAVSMPGSPQFAGVPFPITVTAADVNGVAIPSYSGAPGLTGSGASGVVSLVPTAAGPFTNGVWTGSATVNTLDTNVVLTVDDGAGHTGATAPFNVQTNLPAMSVAPATDASSSGPQGGPFVPAGAAYTITNSGTGSLSWTVSNTQSWLTLSSTSGTLLTGSTVTVTATLNSAANALSIGSYGDAVSFTNLTNDTGDTTRAMALTVLVANPVLSVSPLSGIASSGTYGGPFTPSSIAYTLSNTGNAPMTWTASKTQAWLTLSATAGAIASGSSATVTASINSAANTLLPGPYSDTVSFANTANGNGNTTRAASLTVIVPAPPVITSSPTATGTIGRAFSYSITASHAPIGYNATGLPPGINVNTGTGLLSGTPTGTGTFYGSISATNLGGTGSTSLVVTVIPKPPAITSLPTATGTATVAFSYQIAASNSPTSYNASALPSGLAVNTATGLISGTPTATGTFASSVSATNLGGTGSAGLTFTILPPPPAVTSLPTATGTYNSAFSFPITATNSPTSYNATGLPSGLNVNTATGLISGTPAATGTFSATVTATNAGGSGSAGLRVTVLLLPPVITSPASQSGTTGAFFSYQVAATNLPLRFSANGLPPGLTIHPGTGLISGTPTTTGTFLASVGASSYIGGGKFYYPQGVALDGAGNLYVTDLSDTVRTVTPGGLVIPLAGSPGASGSSDGVGSAAAFNGPDGIGLDSAGNLYVVDSTNYTIRKVTLSGTVTTLAGSPGARGMDDGPGSAARFYFPSGLALDGSGNIYVGDAGNNTIRQLTPAGMVTTMAGIPGVSGSADGTGTAAIFSWPHGVAADGSGNVYVADECNDTIRIITSAGAVSTLAGSPGVTGTANGPGNAAGFTWPVSVALDNAGTIYVSDLYNHTLRKVTPTGVVSTLAGSPGVSGTADGSGAAARFNFPKGLAVDADGTVYVADYGNHAIRKVTSAGIVTTLAGVPGVSGTDNSLALTGSATLSIVVSPASIATPAGLNAIARNAQVVLSWTPSTDAAGYNVKRSLLSGSNYSAIVSNLALAGYTDTSVTNGITYYYVVSAVNGETESANSVEVSARPTAPIGGGESAAPVISVSGANVRLTMANSVTGHTYQLQRSDSLALSSWIDVGSPQTGNGGGLILQDAAGSSGVTRRFYRIWIQQ